MKRYFAWLTLVVMVALSHASSVSAQPPSGYVPFARPQLSPYLNFLRGGDPATNYYLGVVRQREQRQFNTRVQSSVNLLQREVIPPSGDYQELFPAQGVTGHPTGFMNYGGYYTGGVGPKSGATRFIGSPQRGAQPRR